MPAPGSQSNPVVAFDGTNYLVVWEDQPGGNSSTICGARVTPQGTVLDPSGIIISDAAFDREKPAVCFDGANYLVVWQDYRKGWAYYIYGARVSPAGQVLDPFGFAISDGPNDARNPALSFDGTDYLVAWEDYNNDVKEPDIYGARVTPGGQVLDSVNLAINTAPYAQYTPAIGFDKSNFLVVWCDFRDTSNARIYGARVTPGGVVLDPVGFVVSMAQGAQATPCLSFDGTNYLVAWEDIVGHMPAVVSIGGTRLTPGGVVLDTSGIAISSSGGVSLPALTFDGQNFLAVWQNVSGSMPASFSICGVRVTPDGAVLDTSELVIAQGPAEVCFTSPAEGSDGTNFLVVWQDDRNVPGEPDIHGARVAPDGAVLDTGGFLISLSARGQYSPAVAFDGTNYLAVWEDDRSGYDDIYGARVTSGGQVLDPAGIAICTAAKGQYTPVIAFDGTNYLVAWEDQRNDTSSDVYGARVTPGGAVLDPNGFVISQAAGQQRSPAVGFAGGNYLVVWEDYRTGADWDIYGARVTPGGTVLDPNGIAVSQSPYQQEHPVIGFDGTNYLVVWDDTRNGADLDIYGARVTPGGQVLEPNGIAICKATGKQWDPALAFDGTNYLVAWGDCRRSVYSDIFGARVTKQGTVLDTAGIFISDKSEYDKLDPALAYDGTNYLVLWEDCCNSGSPDIYGTRVTKTGAVFDYGRVIQQDGVQSNLAMTRGSGNHLFLVYQSWTGMVGGKTYNTDRVWGDMNPTPGGGIEETPSAEVRTTNRLPTIVRGVLLLPEAVGGERLAVSAHLLDISGSRVMDLHPGANDVSRLAPGVYFVRSEPSAASRQPSAVAKVVVTR